MRIRVNGVDTDATDGATVVDLLAYLAVPSSGVAVAVDGEVVPKAQHADTVLAEGAVVEVLTAVQGG